MRMLSNKRKREIKEERGRVSVRQRDDQSGSRNRRVTASLIRFFHERGGFQLTGTAHTKSVRTTSDLHVVEVAVIATWLDESVKEVR